jgi:hypothetical protein
MFVVPLLCALRYSLFGGKYMVLFSSRISLLIFLSESIGDRGVLKFPTTTVLESICGFKSFSICLVKLGAQTLGVLNFTIL